MGLWDTIKVFGEAAVESVKNRNIEELCNGVNKNGWDRGMCFAVLCDKLRELSEDELFEYYEEYSMYRVQDAADTIRGEISSRISKMKNRELFELLDDYEDDEKMADVLKKELQKRGCI